MPGQSRGGGGFYALQPALRGSAESPILIEGVDANLTDIVYPVATLDENKYLFVMGEDFGNITVSGVALLGKAELNGMAFRKVKDYFDSNRSSAGGGKNPPITASLPGDVALKFYLTRLAVGKPDPEFHLQFFSFGGIIAEPSNSGSANGGPGLNGNAGSVGALRGSVGTLSGAVGRLSRIG